MDGRRWLTDLAIYQHSVNESRLGYSYRHRYVDSEQGNFVLLEKQHAETFRRGQNYSLAICRLK